jgi:ABC-2 type transport system ATP-binding protein
MISLGVGKMGDQQILRVEGLEKSYKVKREWIRAVRSVSLDLSAGEVLAFLGPNGAGKTTSIKMMAGLVRPDGGSVRILGGDPHREAQVLRHVGAVLEGNRNLYWRLTPEENLEYFGVLRGLSRRVARSRGRELLDRFELSHKRDAVVQQLSRGMQQKVAIAVALVHDPKLILLDEPTLGLDVEATMVVKRLVREIAAEGRGIILTTHQLDVAEELSDRVAIINQGAIVRMERTMDLIAAFSGGLYEVVMELLPEAMAAKVVALGAVVEGTTIRVPDTELLYGVLDLVRPGVILSVSRQQANLTDIFLELVQGDR